MTTGTGNRIAVVTGGGRGIGQAICQGLARRGMDVVAVDLVDPIETVALVEGEGRKALGVTGDVADPDDVARIGAEITAGMGGCHVLVNNAGIYPAKNIFKLEYEAWRRVLAVNLDSQFLMTKAVLHHMCEARWGRIVNLTSNSVGLALPGFTHYMASKMGVIGFTRALASDVASYGITVNAVGPTLSRTPGLAESPMAGAAQEHVAAMQAIKRPGEAQDVVGTVAFLASDDAAFVTGQTIMADGGLVRL
ncbi:SDR family NAD(P)-dependent oxidoreductase [Micromonospora sp. HUAS LYJ1]|uniref:SDR family NAD(P)-dependent oxidoreductase n=1 Tax=Micromonospora sp. HUAS LYJ1 TaxID=3061626 RepID=UPI0026727609|nr:SDR family oxidoreductase [Micromonospora sp. HUAS LYJ1]WKU06710.1 SDR family oxidoreductase [Micromonospora sp. HUAS LYJ1]